MVNFVNFYLRVLEPVLMIKYSNLSPPVPEGSRAKFQFYSRSLKEGRNITVDEFETFSGFNPRHDTKILVHGFYDQVKPPHEFLDIKDKYLKRENLNVFVVHWSPANSLPYYRAVSNVPLVGKEIAELVSLLKDRFNARPQSFHIIGHSLGAHIAGFAGKGIKSLGRITGLDPALPPYINVTVDKRLHRTDALFVDVIHTNAGGLGIGLPLGHVDFYPNGGVRQERCGLLNFINSYLKGDLKKALLELGCSHDVVLKMFLDSIEPRSCCPMMASPCFSWPEYEAGKCDCGSDGTQCARMGDMSDLKKFPPGTQHYFRTAPNEPFGVIEYSLTIVLDNGQMVFTTLREFSVTLIRQGKKDIVITKRNSAGRNVFVSNEILGVIQKANLRTIPNSLIHQRVEKLVITRMNFHPIEQITLCVTERLQRDLILSSSKSC